MNDILNQLNPRQQEAVKHKEGPLLILAGAGSGKTRVLTSRIAYLIEGRKIKAENILAITFTNKAAIEMKERVKKILTTTETPWVGTFHSFCAKILRKDGHFIGISPDFLIYDDTDQLDAIKEAMLKLDISNKKYNPRSILATISQAKNELIGPLEYPQYAHGQFQELVSKVYIKYQNILKNAHALDFDDLLLETVNLFKKNPQVLKKYQNTYQYILVDEWQDTNKAQYILVKLLVGPFRNLCVVGDASQSIYAFRGADYRNLNYLNNDFPELKIINLEQNYRSTQKILDAAYQVIKFNQSHPILQLWTENEIGDRIGLYQAQNEMEEATFVINKINELLIPSFENSRKSLTYSDFAVLYRTNAQSRIIEEAFLHAGIPYLLVGGVRFYERKEIKDILAYLRYLINENDFVSLTRIEKLGKNRLKNFQKWILELKSKMNPKEMQTLDLVDEVMNNSHYLELYDTNNEEDLARLENIRELRSVATEFPQIMEFLENVALVQQEYLSTGKAKEGANQDAVTLMTIHSAKGLEYPVVFIVGAEEGLFPHSRSLLDPYEIEEERRLCYVAITRAKQKLFISHATRRLYFGQHTSNMVSRFVTDIPEELIEVC